MKIRIPRLKVIEKIIQERAVCNQEQLQAILLTLGFNVTQATLSRDLHTLKAYRVHTDSGLLQYVLPSLIHHHTDRESADHILRGCLSATHSGNLIIFRTPNGFAQAFAIALEHLALDDIGGVIAGYDTVFVALKENTHSDSFYRQISQKVPGLKIPLG